MQYRSARRDPVPRSTFGNPPRPEICRFLGIIISMYYDEHNPLHFHIRYNEYRSVMDIRTLNLLNGNLPAKVRGLVEE